MTGIRKRPRLLAFAAIGSYLLAAITVSDVQSLEVPTRGGSSCPSSLLPPPAPTVDQSAPGKVFTILQGNLWMLPARPLLLPFPFSTDRKSRLERLIRIVQSCRPAVVLLQEVFERPMVRLLARHLPEYRVLTSGQTDLTGILNASGLVTLTRLPVEDMTFHEFGPLPRGTKTVEALARKGVLAVDISAPGFRGTILNLHLYASRDSEEARVTWDQMKEVLSMVEEMEARGRPILVAGDFNIPRKTLLGSLEPGWRVSEHGPTFDAQRNPYTVQGSNDTPIRHRERRLGLGVRTIDLLLSPPGTALAVRSRVLDRLFISDHQFIQHTVLARSVTTAEPDRTIREDLSSSLFGGEAPR